MANPRRSSFSGQIPFSDGGNPYPAQAQAQTRTQKLLNSLKQFLKKPHAFPLILSALLFLTWLSLRLQFQHNPNDYLHVSRRSFKNDKDHLVNLVRFSSSSKQIMKDERGWMMDPISVALHYGISGGAISCEFAHLGEIRPGSQRGNHRHHFCNETFLIWGAATLFRLENPAVEKGYAQTTIGSDEVAVVASHVGTAHALVNVDPTRTTFFLGCQDHEPTSNSSSDYKVWKDL